jgi:hypothetical protein
MSDRFKFVIDNSCAHLGHMLREFGYDAESVYEVQKKPGYEHMYKDASVRRYAAKTRAVLITSDWGLYFYCRNITKQPCFLVYDGKGLYSKREQLMTIIAHFDPTYSRNWLSSGMPSMGAELKYEGDWNRIRKPYTERKIEELYCYDILGYANKKPSPNMKGENRE